MSNYDFTLDLENPNTMSIINNWISEGSVVLEIGSANGRLTKHLSQAKHCEVVIVEKDAEAGNDASIYAVESYIGDLYGDVENYKWLQTNRRFDYVILADVLEHLPHPEEVLNRCKSVLKSGGRYLISIPNISHNSVIIELFNDKFYYDKAGLLDRTHIHFFTDTTFKKMIELLDLYIVEKVNIYSRVGHNEILNTYDSVSSNISDALRKRHEGSVYQYIYNISYDKTDKKEEKIEIFDMDDKAHFETECFYMNEEDETITQDKKLSKTIDKESYIKIQFEFPDDNIEKIRWDPIEFNCIILFHRCTGRLKNGEFVNLEIESHNAEFSDDEIYIFTKEDPNIFFNNVYGIMEIEIVFSILDYHFNCDENLSLLLNYLNNQNGRKIELTNVLQDKKNEIEQLEIILKDKENEFEQLELKLKDKVIEINKLNNIMESQLKDLHDIKSILEEVQKHPIENIFIRIRQRVKEWIK